MELQMGATGPRRLVSQSGLEFTVGIKYETILSLYICFSLFVHSAGDTFKCDCVTIRPIVRHFSLGRLSVTVCCLNNVCAVLFLM